MQERYKRVKRLFEKVCDLDPDERRKVLAEECADDPTIREEVESLVRHAPPEEEPTAADATPPPGAPSGTPSPASPLPFSDGNGHPERIGPYRIIRRLGHGGMGVVYLGERADRALKGFVAVKVIRRGMDTEEIVRRFEQERDVLKALKDPCIARLEDAGETDDGLPYFAIEYVEGVPIDRYCDDNRLSIRARLELFREVCLAVQHAHDYQIVHRDLKPGHILITRDGQPKLLDFGIAKLLNPALAAAPAYPTAPQRGFMTPEYASPEQARRGVIRLTSDVYSLGVILYELLTGHRPYRFRDRYDETEVREVICGSQPPRPSAAVTHTVDIVVDPETGTTDRITPERVSMCREGRPDRLRRRLAGDVDNIILKALRKEPDQRYRTAQQFAEDIERHLDGMPVIARPDSVAYRAAKFVRRHRVGVATAAAVTLAIILGWTRATLASNEARTQRDRAEAALGVSLDLANGFLFDLYDEFRFVDGTQEAREFFVTEAVKYLGKLATIEDEGNTALLSTLANAYGKLGNVEGSFREPGSGNFQAALGYHRTATSYLDDLVAASPRDGKTCKRLATSHIYTGDALKHTGRLTEGLSEYQAALDELARVDEPEPRYHRAAALKSQARVLEELGRLDAAEARTVEALDLTAALVDELETDDPTHQYRRGHAVSLIHRGDRDLAAGRSADALASYEQAIAIRKAWADAPGGDNAKSRDALAKGRYAAALALLELDRPRDAAERLGEARHGFQTAAEANPNDLGEQLNLARWYVALGRTSLALGEPQEAIVAFRRAQTRILDVIADSDSLNVREVLARCNLRLGEAELARGNADPAIAEFEDALAILSRLIADSPESFTLKVLRADVQRGIGSALAADDRWSEAAAKLESARSSYETLDELGPGYASVREGLATTLHELAFVLAEQDDAAGAARTAEDALAALDEAPASPKVQRLRDAINADLERWRPGTATSER